MTEQAPVGAERRRDPREPAHLAGRAWFGAQAARWADCIVEDLSCSGARITSDAVKEFPERIIFAHEKTAAVFLAIVKWRSATAAGLSFAEGYALADCNRAPLDRLAAEWTSLYAGDMSPARP